MTGVVLAFRQDVIAAADNRDSSVQRLSRFGRRDVARRAPDKLTRDVVLRDVTDGDLPIFFEQQLDSTANHMAAFTCEDPTDRDAFDAHWTKILGDDTITTKTIVFGGNVAGHIASFERFGQPEVTYWIGKEYWGNGVATRALAEFLGFVKVRPLYARAAKDNVASLRVLEKCGFAIAGDDKGFANARGEDVEEFILTLTVDDQGESP
jgi:RimJ/RimL family protein N-acetyltransferase